MDLTKLIGCRLINLWITDWQESEEFDFVERTRYGFLEIDGIGVIEYKKQPTFLTKLPPNLKAHEESNKFAGEVITDILVSILHCSIHSYTQSDRSHDIFNSLLIELGSEVTLSNLVYSEDDEGDETVYSGPGIEDMKRLRQSCKKTDCRIHKWSDWQKMSQ